MPVSNFQLERLPGSIFVASSKRTSNDQDFHHNPRLKQNRMSGQTPIYSSMAGDPGFQDLLELFAESMQEKKRHWRKRLPMPTGNKWGVMPISSKGQAGGMDFQA